MLLLVGEPGADRPASPPRRPACAHIDTGRVSMSHVPADARETPAEVLDGGVVLRAWWFPVSSPGWPSRSGRVICDRRRVRGGRPVRRSGAGDRGVHQQHRTPGSDHPERPEIVQVAPGCRSGGPDEQADGRRSRSTPPRPSEPPRALETPMATAVLVRTGPVEAVETAGWRLVGRPERRRGRRGLWRRRRCRRFSNSAIVRRPTDRCRPRAATACSRSASPMRRGRVGGGVEGHDRAPSSGWVGMGPLERG